MQKWILAITLLVVSITGATAQSYDEQVREYISQYKDMAIKEQQRSGIPAAITLAQGIHETSAGSSQLATIANNHFGIKCKKDWTGETFAYTDDAPDECFRKYSSAKQSYKDHSDYLSTAPRYAALFTLSKTDYASWAFGLRKCGYATNPRYAQVLIKLIEDYRLQEFTYAAMDNNMGGDVAAAQPKEIVPEHDAPATTVAAAVPVATPVIPVETIAGTPKRKSKIVVDESPDVPDMPVTFPPYGDVVRVNKLKAVYAKKGDMPLEYALKTNIRYEKLLEINDISDRPLAADMYLYLERKHVKGLHPAHVVKEGETIAQVSQYEGVLAKTIRSLNKLEADEEPAVGATLQLQADAETKPATIAKAAPATQPAVVTVEAPVVTPPPAVAATQPATPIEENTLAGNTNGAEPSMQMPPPVKTENTVATTPPPAAEVKTEPATVAVAVPDPATAPAVEVPAPPPADTKPENTVATVITVPAPDPAPVAADPVPATPTDIGPAKPADVTPPAAEVVSTEKTLPNPPPPINIANEKPIEEVIAAEKKAQPAPPAAEEPKDELDALKAKFDKVVYSRKTTPVTPPPAAEVKTETPVAPPPAAEVKKEPEQQPVASAKTGARFYVVKKGDTAFSIAKKNNITMHDLVEWNKLDFEAIKVGQRLRIQP